MGNFVNRTDLTSIRSENDLNVADPPWLFVASGSVNDGLITTVPAKYLKIAGDVLSEMTQPEKDVVDAADLAAQIAASRQAAIDALGLNEPLGHESRAIIEWFAGQRNVHITRMEEIHAAFTAMKDSTGGIANLRGAIPASFGSMANKGRDTVVTEIETDLAAQNQDV